MKDKPIQHTHRETVITYDEDRNVWTFTLRGRDRSAESLTKAREIIDKPEPKEKKPFEKIKAWYMTYQSDPERVEITGIAESGWRGDGWVWIKTESGRRSKESTERKIYPSNTKNDALIGEIIAKRKSIAALDDECEKLTRKLESLKLEIPE